MYIAIDLNSGAIQKYSWLYLWSGYINLHFCIACRLYLTCALNTRNTSAIGSLTLHKKWGAQVSGWFAKSVRCKEILFKIQPSSLFVVKRHSFSILSCQSNLRYKYKYLRYKHRIWLWFRRTLKLFGNTSHVMSRDQSNAATKYSSKFLAITPGWRM